MFLSSLSNNMISTKSLTCLGLVVGLSVLINLYGHPYPDSFDQPIKYRLLCLGAEFLNSLGELLQVANLSDPLDLIRFAYHWTIGAFNIRDPADGIHVEDEYIEHCSMRIFRPLNQTAAAIMPTIIYYHGGGHFVGSADVFEPVNYILAKQTNFQVFYIEFRLIPENRFPAQLNDAMLVTNHLLKKTNHYKIDTENIVLMGDSAGGNLATVIGQKLISENLCQPKLQVLIYPLLQFFDFTLPSYRINLPKRILGNIHHQNLKNFLHFLTNEPVDDTLFLNGHTSHLHKDSLFSRYVNADLLPSHFSDNLAPVSLLNDTRGFYTRMADIILDKSLSPLLVSDEYLAENTPENTFLVTAEMDILRDDGFIYAERLRRVGKRIHHKHYDDMFHGVFNLIHGPLTMRQAHELMEEITSFVLKTVNN